MRKLRPFGTFYRQAHLRSISIFSDRVSPLPWFITAFDGTSLYSAQDLPQIDVLLITHDHYDHLDYPTILAIDPLVSAHAFTRSQSGKDRSALSHQRIT